MSVSQLNIESMLHSCRFAPPFPFSQFLPVSGSQSFQLRFLIILLHIYLLAILTAILSWISFIITCLMDSLFFQDTTLIKLLYTWTLASVLRWTTGVSPGSASCVCDLCAVTYDPLLKVLCLITYSAVCLEILSNFEQGAPHFHFVLGS